MSRFPPRPSPSSRLVLLALVALLPGLACGAGEPGAGQASSGSPGARPPASAAAKPVIDFATCGGFGAADAATLFGAPAAAYESRRSEQSWGTDCSFVSAGDPMREQAVSFTLSRAASAAAAAEDMAQLAGNAGIADDALDTKGVSHRVAGIGDEALWVAANGSLYVRAGAVTVIVTEPTDEAKQVEVARALLGD